MKILVLAWEFPPRIVGGIARHVAELYPELVKLGHSIHLITVEFGHAPMYEVVEGIRVHRVVVGHARDFFHWVANLNQSMGKQGGKLMLEEGPLISSTLTIGWWEMRRSPSSIPLKYR